MTDQFRAMCAELVAIEDALSGGSVQFSNQGQALDGYSALATFRDVADRARALLAQPEPEGPSDDELDELFTEIDQSGEALSWRLYARAALARWGRPAAAPVPEPGEVEGVTSQ